MKGQSILFLALFCLPTCVSALLQMWLVVVAPKDPAEERCTLSILETFLWKAMKPFQTYSTWQCYYAFAEKVVPHLASSINANNIGLRGRLLTRHVEREECIPNSKLFSLVSGLVSQLVFQLVWDALSVLWLVSKNSCAIGETVWGLRWCNSIPPHNFAAFGSKVLAELPQSLVQKSPNAPRFHAAAFLHPGFGSMGVVVMAKIRIGKELVARTFIAKSIKVCLPISISNDFNIFVQLVDERSGLPIEGKPQEEPQVSLPENQPPNLKCPISGPPLKWIEEFGITKGCGACKSVEIYGSRQSKNHSKTCCQRYETWLKQQALLQSEPGGALEDPAFDSPGGKVSDEAELSVEARAELDEMFNQEFEMNPEVHQSSGNGISRPASGQQGFEEPPNKRPKRNGSFSEEPVVVVEKTPDSVVDEKDVSEYAPTEPEGDDGLDVGDVIETVDASASGLKRESDTPIEQLEHEIQGSDRKRVSSHASGLVAGLFENLTDCDDESLSLKHLAVFSFLATESERPCIVLPASSIRFDDNATSVVVGFGDKKIGIWKPANAIDDASLKELCGEAALQGVVKEMKNLESMEAGDLYAISEYEASGLGGTCRTIPSRWVTAGKGKDETGNPIVRSRIVLKDLSKGSGSARVLGISSPAPSSDGLNLLLSIAGIRDWFVGVGEVSWAFMATPLRKRSLRQNCHSLSHRCQGNRYFFI